MGANRPFTLGAVAYDPKVVTIWEGFGDWLAGAGFPFEYVLYANYEQQVEAHLAGHTDVTWDSPLAWVRTRRLAAAAGRQAEAALMRDTDQDLTSVVLVRDESNLAEPAQLSGRRIATGASDSPQATLIPLAHLGRNGVDLAAATVVHFDVAVGKHGDHIGGERLAVEALLAGEADAACVIDGNQALFAREGTIEPGALRVLTRTAPYDHCTMTVLDPQPGDASTRFVELLGSMSYSDPRVRPLFDLEGLTEWRRGRTSGYAQLEAAVDRLGHYRADSGTTER